MRKALMLAVILLLACATTATGEIEMGMGLSPSLEEPPDQVSEGFFGDAAKILHVGCSFAWLFHLSYDGLILPPYAVSRMTGSTSEATGIWSPGYFRPAFLNTFNVGIRPQLGPFLLTVSAGVNSMYIFREVEDNLPEREMGVNLRAGLGLRIAKTLSLNASATVLFASFEEMLTILEALVGGDAALSQSAQERILGNLMPAAVLCLHL